MEKYTLDAYSIWPPFSFSYTS